ncbi:MAG: PDZ domain-containing protein [Akkermansiaceae bacterium]|nr:PDZ domain-containing protein [Akkermansiaceae bacterium]
MRTILITLLALLAVSPAGLAQNKGAAGAAKPKGLVRVNSTLQSYSAAQPWERTNPVRRRGLGAVLPGKRILTTAEMAADATYIELESSDGTRTAPATVLALDYEANLALLAPEDPALAGWLQDIKPLRPNGAVTIGETVNIWQLEDNGEAIRTSGTVRSVDLLSTFIEGHYFLAYEVKASMQSASSSYTLPVTRDGKLIGVLTSYSSKDQISDVVAPEIIESFLADVKDGTYEGFPSLGIATVLTEDPLFRDYLGLTDDQGGIYISRVVPGSAANDSGLEAGDVILRIDGKAIDRRGYYDDPLYGRLFWSHLVRGMKKVGDALKLDILREGKPETITANVRRAPEKLIPDHIHDSPPAYLIKGGLVFQELSRQYLEAYGDKWQTRAPLGLLDALRNPEDYEEGRNRLIFLSRVIATPATIGYENVGNRIVTEVNGQPIADMESLVEAFRQPTDELHMIRIDDVPYVLYLDAEISDVVDKQLLESGLQSLSRIRE